MREVAEMFRISPTAVYELIEKKELHGHVVGRQLRIPNSEIHRYIADNIN